MTARDSDLIGAARSLLFVPGNRPERFAKAAAAQPDMVIVDLEDAVAPGDKDAARNHAAEWVAAGNPAMIRINGRGTAWYGADLAMVTSLGVPTMLPKADADTIGAVAASGVRIVALIETAVGVLDAPVLARMPGVERLAFGSIDLASELGVEPADREAFMSFRSSLVVASAAARLAGPIDGVTTVLDDEIALRTDVRHARRLGMTAKLCIHPAQVGVVHEGLAPSAEDIAWARRIVADMPSNGSATSIDGEMVDAPVLARARRILADAPV
jgi:citrate lyase subunit beta/citryl-CoA lyase